MDQFFARVLAHEHGLQIASMLCVVAGGVTGACLLEVRSRMRRTIYFLWVTVLLLMSALIQAAWLRLPVANQSGYFAVFCVAVLALWVPVGILAWRVAAARSNDGWGDTRRAWLAFVPFGVLWLILKPGQARWDWVPTRRERAGKAAGDLLVVVLGVFVIVGARGLVGQSAASFYDRPGGQELGQMLLSSMPLGESLARQAAVIDRELPPAPDEAPLLDIYLRGARAEGATLELHFVLQHGARPEERAALAAVYCHPASFGAELARGARIVALYASPDGTPLAEREITGADCAQPPPA